ncbi:MAG: hypothetical protein ACKOJ9_05040 [Actinomycetota bacterium]
MSDAAREAKAEAKAAKARAKGLRPFYKMKRWWLLAIVVAIAVGSALGSSGSEGSSDSGSSKSSGSGESSTDNSIGTGLGSKDASADINSLDCGTPDSIGITYPSVSVTNNSSKTSTYFITVVAESADGATKYDDTTIMITELASGQTMTEEGMFTNELPAGAICKITEVQRTAS